MGLSFQEKRALQKEIADYATSLERATDFKSKRTLQKRLAEAFSRLEGRVIKAGKTLFDQLVAGEFLKVSPVRFLKVVKSVLAETDDNIQPIREPILSYLRAHYNESAGIFESLFRQQPR